MVPSLWEEFYALTGALPAWVRRAGTGLLLGIGLLFVATARHLTVRDLLAWLLAVTVLGAGLVLYLGEVQQTRHRLRAAVRGEPDPAPSARPSVFVRPQSLLELARAVRLARAGEVLAAERRLQHVDRLSLGEWESRVIESVRVLACLERGEDVRAAQLAPLALPTGDVSLDRQLGCLMLRAAWRDERRLGAIERALVGAGPGVHDLVLLCRAQQQRLAHGEVRLRLAPRLCARVSSAAVLVGDDELAATLLTLGESAGAYR